MTKEKWYRLVYDVLRPIGALLYPQKFYGLENIPEGPAILCAPHSNVADPILISFALGRKTYVHHLAKAESKTMFIFGWLMKKAGSIFVKRGERDIDSFKQCMRVLKAGEKLIVFPEGTRVREGDVSHPHVGAVTFACRTDAPIVPVFLTRKKRFWAPLTLVFGEAYHPQFEGRRPSSDELEHLTQEMMDKCYALGGMQCPSA